MSDRVMAIPYVQWGPQGSPIGGLSRRQWLTKLAKRIEGQSMAERRFAASPVPPVPP